MLARLLPRLFQYIVVVIDKSIYQMKALIYSLFLILLASLSNPAFAGGEVQYQEGLKAYKARNYRAAAKSFNESLESGNGSAEVYLYLAHSYAASGEKTKALKKYHDIVKIFKGLPAEQVALPCIKRLDPHNTFRDMENVATSGNTKKLSLVNRIFILPPTIQGHPPVSPDSVGTIRSVVSHLPKYVYDMLDKNGVNIYIGPNMSDKWPDALTGSKPGAEHMTMSQECARTYDTEIYFFERPTKIGSKDLGQPMGQDWLRREAYYQISHAVDFCLKIAEDKRLRAEYNYDKGLLREEQKHMLTYYLQPDYKGVGEVVACALLQYFAGEEIENVAEHFPRTWKWVQRRIEEERVKRPDLKPANPSATLSYVNPKTNPAQAVQIGVSTNRRKSPSSVKYEKPASVAATSSATSLDDLLTKPEDPPDPSDVLPEEDHVHFYKDPDGKPMVNGLLNGRPFSMLIDTGAHRTVVGKKYLHLLNIPVPKEKPTRFSYGAGGQVFYWIMPFEISVGKTKRKMHVCVIDNEDFICLGQSFLRGLSYRFDNSKNSIFVSKNAAKTQRLMAQDAAEIPYRYVNGSMIIILKVEGKNLETNFDTGAHGFLIGYTQAKQQGIFQNKEFMSTTLRGMGGKSMESVACVVDSVELGPMKWTNVPATVYGGYSVIGQDFFGDRHFVIDHEKRVIRFSRR